jgi:hypothetical protein
MLTRTGGAKSGEKRWLITTTIVLGIVAAWATPLMDLSAFGVLNAPDLALAATIIGKGQVIWQRGFHATMPERVGFAAIFFCFGLMAILATKRRWAVYCLVSVMLSVSLIGSLAEHWYIKTLGTSASPTNDAIRFLREHDVDFEHAVGFDRSFAEGSIHFFVAFWNTSPRPLRYFSGYEIEKRIDDGHLKYFVSPNVLAFPVAYSTRGIYVYLLNGRRRD